MDVMEAPRKRNCRSFEVFVIITIIIVLTITSVTIALLSSSVIEYTPADEDKDILVYFGTKKDGIKVYSSKTLEVSTAIATSAPVIGVTYDTLRDKLYWTTAFTSGSAGSTIQRSQVKAADSAVEMLLSTSQYGFLRGMCFDWITGNVYVVSSYGYVLACDGRLHGTFSCATVLSDQGNLIGIALNPTQGILYWTKAGSGSIMKAGMDGSNPTTIVTGLNRPAGITIDFPSSRLYWADRVTQKIQSSDLDGADVITIVTLSKEPYGIALLHQRLYWSLEVKNVLQTGRKAGGDVHTVYTAASDIRHFAVSDWFHPRNRTDPCGQQVCSRVCVQSPSSYRCL